MLKTFVFQFVNSYTSFFFIAFFKDYFEGVKLNEGGHMTHVQLRLSGLLSKLVMH